MAKNEVDSAIQKLLKLGIKVTKLWENASPTSTFKGQEVKVAVKSNDFVLIETNYSTTASSDEVFIMDPTRSAYLRELAGAGYSNIGYSSRYVEFTDTAVKFSDNYTKTAIGSTTGGTVNNTYQIPKRIFGIKLLGGVQLKAYLRRFRSFLQRGCRSCVA